MITLIVPTLREMDAFVKYDEGVDAGVILGRKEEKFDTARRMKAAGLSDAQIAGFTDLTLNEIATLGQAD